MNELQAGVEVAFAVFPQPPVLFQPGKAAFDHPTLGDNGKLVQFAALGDLHRDAPTQYRKRPANTLLTRLPIAGSGISGPERRAASGAAAALRAGCFSAWAGGSARL